MGEVNPKSKAEMTLPAQAVTNLNHYIAVEGRYLMVHCGTRNLGVAVAEHYQNIAVATRDKRMAFINDTYNNAIHDAGACGDYSSIELLKTLRKAEVEAEPENDLCYLKGQDMRDYLHDVGLLRSWSLINHMTIAHEIYDGMGLQFPGAPSITSLHNYVDVENHIIRKGAISLRENEGGIIPLNMADGSLIVRGLGNEDYLWSGPHGAGRVMSRKKARESIDMADYEKSMEGIYTTSVCRDTLDESPQSYKNAAAIEEAIAPVAEIVEHVRPYYNFKAKG